MTSENSKKPKYKKAMKQVIELLITLPDAKEERKQYWYDWILWIAYTYKLPKSVLGDLKTHYVFNQQKRKHIDIFESLHNCRCFK